MPMRTLAVSLFALGSILLLACPLVPANNKADSGATATDSGAQSGDGGDVVDGGAVADSGGSARQVCVEVCSGASAYCTPPTECDGTRCVFPATEETPCDDDDGCVPEGSFWDLGDQCVTADADCAHRGGDGDLLEACIKVGAVGHCVRMPQSASDCQNRSQVEIPWTDIQGNAVTVCGRRSEICENNICVPGCQADGDCGSSLKPECDTAAHHCVCTATSCINANNGKVCKADGTCGCDTDADCPGAGFDRCFGGVCGCSTTAVCQDMLPSINVVCE
jgi:hypothetical protein